MPKKRLDKHKGLPKRWEYTHGAYYYRVPPGLEDRWDGKTKFRLGRTLSESYLIFGKRIKIEDEDIRTVGDLLDKYLLMEVPKKASTTRESNRTFIIELKKVFSDMPLLPFPPKYIYQYFDKREFKTAAHRELEVLSHSFTKAVEWGLIDNHPFIGQVRLPGEKPRSRYLENWEYDELFRIPNKGKGDGVAVVQAYLRLKYLTGLDRGDMLRLEPCRQFQEDGIHVIRHKTGNKTGKKYIYTWSPELRDAVQNALAVRPVDASQFLFCNRSGNGYLNEEKGTCYGWKSLWQRFHEKVMATTKIQENFTERDIRAKVASDAESLQHATDLLSHADPRTTERIYRRKPVKVKPLK